MLTLESSLANPEIVNVNKAVVFCKVGLRTRRPEISENPKKIKTKFGFFF